MNLVKINVAIEEAKKFIERAEVVQEKAKNTKDDYWLWPSKENAALKRQSMELTRALAELRKPM